MKAFVIKLLRALFQKKFYHPRGVTAVYLPLAFFISWIAYVANPHPPIRVFLWVGVGLGAWTLIEYLLHRYIFHLTRVKNPFLLLIRGNHWGHHHYPDQDSLITPPIGSSFYGALVYCFWAAITLSFSTAAFIEAGVLVGYVLYEWAHYSAHRFHPKRGWSLSLKKYHLYHHYQNPHRCFGVTTPFWDYVFNTAPK